MQIKKDWKFVEGCLSKEFDFDVYQNQKEAFRIALIESRANNTELTQERPVHPVDVFGGQIASRYPSSMVDGCLYIAVNDCTARVHFSTTGERGICKITATLEYHKRLDWAPLVVRHAGLWR